MADLAPITRELFGEVWDSFDEPRIPELPAIKRAIAEIAGFSSGRPILRLDWLPRVLTRRMGKERLANVVYETQVPYREFYSDHRALWLNQFQTVEIPLPRFGLRMLVPDSLARKTWERDRWKWEVATINGGPVTVRVDLLGPFPSSGHYQEVGGSFSPLAFHLPEAACCREALEQGLTCYGRYRAPDWQLVENIRKAWAKKKAEKQYRMPDEEATALELNEYANKRLDEVDAANRVFWEATAAQLGEEINLAVPDGAFIDLGAARPKPAATIEVVGL